MTTQPDIMAIAAETLRLSEQMRQRSVAACVAQQEYAYSNPPPNDVADVAWWQAKSDATEDVSRARIDAHQEYQEYIFDTAPALALEVQRLTAIAQLSQELLAHMEDHAAVWWDKLPAWMAWALVDAGAVSHDRVVDTERYQTFVAWMLALKGQRTAVTARKDTPGDA